MLGIWGQESLPDAGTQVDSCSQDGPETSAVAHTASPAIAGHRLDSSLSRLTGLPFPCSGRELSLDPFLFCSRQ